MYFDTPRDFIGGVYENLLYDDQPLGWDIIGRKETVRGATRETFTEYVERWYRAERMVVGVGGRLGDGLLERLEDLVGDVPSRGSAGGAAAGGAARRTAHASRCTRRRPTRRTSSSVFAAGR